ncbi:MAG: CHAD domain-containing protein [Armatimonadetes bacterium]|nr:CHAD domain-containing protein [Armatimonadota bacterium]
MPKPVTPADDLRDCAQGWIAQRLSEMLEWEPFIRDPAYVTELHAMRIAAKRLRYTMEIFAPYSGGGLEGLVESVKQLQETLGEIHDADVLAPELAGQARKELAPLVTGGETIGAAGRDLESVVGLAMAAAAQQRQRKALYRTFVAQWRAFRKGGAVETLQSGAYMLASEPATKKAKRARPTPPAAEPAAEAP